MADSDIQTSEFSPMDAYAVVLNQNGEEIERDIDDPTSSIVGVHVIFMCGDNNIYSGIYNGTWNFNCEWASLKLSYETLVELADKTIDKFIDKLLNGPSQEVMDVLLSTKLLKDMMRELDESILRDLKCLIPLFVSFFTIIT